MLEIFLKRGIYAGVFLITLLPLIISNSLFFPYITGKAFFFRVLVEIVFSAWLVLIVRDADSRPRRGIILWSVVVWVISAILATIFSLNPTVSFWSNFERMEGLVTFLHIFVFFLVASSVFRDKLWFWFSNTTLVVSVWVSFMAVSEYFSAVGTRVDATLGNPTYLASYILFHIFIAGVLYHKYANQIKNLNWIYGGVILLHLFVLFETQTRGAILGLFGGVVVTALIMALFGRDYKKERKIASISLLLLAVVSGGFFLVRDTQIIQSNPTLSRLANISLEDSTTKSRFVIWEMAFDGFKERPILGWGFENFSVVFGKYYNPEIYDQEQWFDRAHNVFFDWLIGGGVIGLLSYLALFVSAIFMLYRSDKFSLHEKSLWLGLLSAYFFHNLFVFDNIVSYFMFFTVLAYLHSETSEQKVFDKVGSQSLQYIVGLVSVVLLVLASTFFVFKPLKSGTDLIQGLIKINNTDEQQLLEARDFFLKAYEGSPIARKQTTEQFLMNAGGVLINQSVSAQTKESFFNESARLMKQELKADPLSARLWLFWGGFLTDFSDDEEEAINALNQALILSPNKPQMLFQLADSYFKFRDNIKAKEFSERAYELASSFREAQIHYAVTLFKMGDMIEGEKVLMKHFGTLAVDNNDIANFYIREKRYDLVIEILENRTKTQPQVVDNWLALVNFYVEIKNYDKALATLKEVKQIATDPNILAQIDGAISQLEGR